MKFCQSASLYWDCTLPICTNPFLHQGKELTAFRSTQDAHKEAFETQKEAYQSSIE